MAFQRLSMQDADVWFDPAPSLDTNLSQLFETLYKTVNWEQRSVKIYNKEIPQPRLVAWYSDYSYTYSGVRLTPQDTPEILKDLSSRISRIMGGHEFNGILLNAYRDGNDSIGMHSDNEVEFGDQPLIASLSLGAERIFRMKRKDGEGETVKIPLPHGSLLVMSGHTQRYWNHGINKTTRPVGPRINLTFRQIKYIL